MSDDTWIGNILRNEGDPVRGEQALANVGPNLR